MTCLILLKASQIENVQIYYCDDFLIVIFYLKVLTENPLLTLQRPVGQMGTVSLRRRNRLWVLEC